MGSTLRNNRRLFWEILNRIIGRKNRIIGTGLLHSETRVARVTSSCRTSSGIILYRLEIRMRSRVPRAANV